MGISRVAMFTNRGYDDLGNTSVCLHKLFRSKGDSCTLVPGRKILDGGRLCGRWQS